jgi:hypothetical protein
MKYKIKIKTKNQMFMINGRNVRTPTEAIVEDDYLKILKAKMKYYGLQESKDYEIFILDSDIGKDYSKIQPKPQIVLEVVKPQEIKEEIKTMVIPTEPIKKTVVTQSFISTPPISCSDSNKKTEQNIKNDVPDTEITIKDLSMKSSTILDKILRGEF